MTDGAQRGLTAMEAKRLPLRSKRNWNPNRKSQNYSKYENPLVFLTKTENQVPKLGNLRTTINTKPVKPKFVWQKTETPI